MAGGGGVALTVLFQRIAYLISRYCRGYAFIEMGVKTVDVLMNILESNGLYVLRKWDMFYGSGSSTRPYCLVCASKEKKEVSINPPPGIRGNVKPPYWAIKNFSQPGNIVFDSCCGLGGTGVACVKLNRVFRGVEYVPKRIRKAEENIRNEIKRLSKGSR